MGCSHTEARELLKSYINILGRELEPDDIGAVIQTYRNKQDAKLIKKYLNSK